MATCHGRSLTRFAFGTFGFAADAEAVWERSSGPRRDEGGSPSRRGVPASLRVWLETTIELAFVSGAGFAQRARFVRESAKAVAKVHAQARTEL